MEGICKFCDNLNLRKQCAGEENKDKDEENKLKHAYNVALVEHTWTKRKGKRNASRSVDFRNQGIGYELNYCPECGKKIRRIK